MKRILRCALLAAAILALLCGCAQEPFGVYTLDGGVVCRVWGSTEGIRRLEVTAADGAVEVFPLKSPDIEPDPDGGVELIDLDFDGHADLRIKRRQYAGGELRHTCFLWRDGRLVQDETLSAMLALEAAPEAKTLTAWEKYIIEEEHESRARLTYVWHEGAPVVIEKVELLHYLEDEIYCRVTYTAAPGEALEMVEEDWIFVEQFDETKIWN